MVLGGSEQRGFLNQYFEAHPRHCLRNTQLWRGMPYTVPILFPLLVKSLVWSLMIVDFRHRTLPWNSPGAGCLSLAQRKVAQQCHDMTTGGRGLSAPQMCSQIGCGCRDLPRAVQRLWNHFVYMCHCFQMGGCYQSGEYPVNINEDSHDGMYDHTAYNCHVCLSKRRNPNLLF